MMWGIHSTDSQCSCMALNLYKDMLTDVFPHFELTFELHSTHSFVQSACTHVFQFFFLDQENNFPWRSRYLMGRNHRPQVCLPGPAEAVTPPWALDLGTGQRQGRERETVTVKVTAMKIPEASP